jgi:hypothetical protein
VPGREIMALIMESENTEITSVWKPGKVRQVVDYEVVISDW